MTLETRVDYDEEPRLFPTSSESSFVHALIRNPTLRLREAIIELFALKPQASENSEITVVPSENTEAGIFEDWVESSQ